jgi:hypothetical protein
VKENKVLTRDNVRVEEREWKIVVVFCSEKRVSYASVF